MKKTIFFLFAIGLLSGAGAQLKTTALCPVFSVDILDGKVNDLEPFATQGQIKKLFPCFTSSEDESQSASCGGTISYKDKDIFFYTGRDYVEIGEKFRGKLSIPLLGAARTALFKWLGHPKIKDLNWDAFQTAYGTLVLYYNKAGKINKIRFSTLSSEMMNPCE